MPKLFENKILKAIENYSYTITKFAGFLVIICLRARPNRNMRVDIKPPEQDKFYEMKGTERELGIMSKLEIHSNV
jgi:hypothetical protein